MSITAAYLHCILKHGVAKNAMYLFFFFFNVLRTVAKQCVLIWVTLEADLRQDEAPGR